MKFIDQKRQHIPADTSFVKKKFLDLRYAPEGEWMQSSFYTPDGKWKTREDEDSSVSNYPGMKFVDDKPVKSPLGLTLAIKLQQEMKRIETVHLGKAIPSKGDVKDQTLCPFPAKEETRLLDIYLPNEGNPPYPVIIDVFGGGWYFGRKSSHKLIPALNLLKRGFAVVSINYSMSFQGQFPVQIQEVKAAVRFIRKHSSEYDLDPQRIALLGESAGAHYAALAAVSEASGQLIDSRWPNQDVPAKVQAVIALYCPVDLSALKEYFAVEKMVRGNDTIISEYGGKTSMESVLFGGPVKDCKWMEKISNPEVYLNAQCPPFLFLSGTKDQVIPITETMHFAAQIMHHTSIDNVLFQVVKGAHHDIHDFEQEWIYDLEEHFLREKMHC